MMVSSMSTRTVLPSIPASSGVGLQPRQQAGRDGVELADMAEGEFPQERPQRRGRIRAVEDRAHRAVPQQGHVVDAVGAGDHPRDQRGYLHPGVGALVGGHAQVLVGQRRQAALLGQRHDRDQTRRTTPDSGHRTPLRPRAECEIVASTRCPSL